MCPLGRCEPQLNQLAAKSCIPSTWSLFETIKSLIQFANIGWMFLIFVSRRLTHIDLFLKNTMKKGILYIQLA